MPKERQTIRVASRTLSVSNLDKPLYPTGFTKGQLIDYYTRIAPFMLGHLRGRPITFKRYPDGIDAPFFFEKTCNAYRPPWVKTATIDYGPGTRDIDHCLLQSPADLAWAANIAAIEIHVSLAKAARIERPTMIVFDLDPGPGADLLDCCRVALRLRKGLDTFSLRCLLKTSGGKGLHVYIPLNTPTTYEQTQPFARALAELLASEQPEKITAIMARNQRRGRVYVDWAQNMLHKTTVAAYSVRARPAPSVSMPVTFEEIEHAISRRSTAGLVFEAPAALARAEKRGDLFEPALTLKQRLPTLTPSEPPIPKTRRSRAVRSG